MDIYTTVHNIFFFFKNSTQLDQTLHNLTNFYTISTKLYTTCAQLVQHFSIHYNTSHTLLHNLKHNFWKSSLKALHKSTKHFGTTFQQNTYKILNKTRHNSAELYSTQQHITKPFFRPEVLHNFTKLYKHFTNTLHNSTKLHTAMQNDTKRSRTHYKH